MLETIISPAWMLKLEIAVFAEGLPVYRKSIGKGKEVPEFIIRINGEKEPLTKEKMLGRFIYP